MEELEEYPREPLDTDTLFAKFTRVVLTDHEVRALSMATLVSPQHVPACEIYLTYVSQCDCYVDKIKQFCLGVANRLAKARKATTKGQYPYMTSYNESWGRYAVADGIVIAMVGRDHAPGVKGEGGRAMALGVDPKSYCKIRNFIAGLLRIIVDDFRMALEWAMGKRRDTVLQATWGRVTGQTIPSPYGHDIISHAEGEDDGCYISKSVDSTTRSRPPALGFSEDGLWRP